MSGHPQAGIPRSEDGRRAPRAPLPRTLATPQITVQVDQSEYLSTLARDVRVGLASRPRRLPPKYFYDARGSALFQRISELPEYYLTRAEQGIIESVGGELMARLQPIDIVELGPGSARKLRLLLDADGASARVERYVPFDLDRETTEAAAERLVEDYPSLEVHGVVGDLELDLRGVPSPIGRRLVAFFGSTIGNLDAEARRELLSRVRLLLGPEDRLLLGVDLVKDVDLLEAAYDDSDGVTAEFNRKHSERDKSPPGWRFRSRRIPASGIV